MTFNTSLSLFLVIIIVIIVVHLSVDILVYLGCSGWCPVIVSLWFPFTLLKFVPSSVFHLGQSSLLMAFMSVVS